MRSVGSVPEATTDDVPRPVVELAASPLTARIDAALEVAGRAPETDSVVAYGRRRLLADGDG